MKNILLLITCCMLVSSAYSQTVPAAQVLPYTQDFSTLISSATTYPAGWQGWNLAAASGNAFLTNAAIANSNLLASSTAATTTGGVHNYNGKIGFLASGTANPSLCVVVNTTGKINIAVTFDVSTIRNPFNNTTETRRNNVELQYCIGSTLGPFTSLTGSIYRNNTTIQVSGTTHQNAARYQYILPASCENQAAIQLRWVQRDSSGAGNRPSFAIDNVIICPAPIVSATVTPTCSGFKNGSISLSISAGMPPYTIAWDTVNKAGPTFAVTAVTKTAQHPYFGVGFTLGYALDAIQGKELTVTRGVNYTFSGTFPNHPFHISTSTTGGSFAGEVSSGVTNSQTQNGALVFTPNNSHPALLYYQCGFHLNMGWRININNGFITGNTLSNLSAGKYMAAISSSDGCITTITVTVGTNTSPVVTASNNGPLCEESNVQLNANGGTSYSWSGTNAFSSLQQNPVRNNVSIADSGSYSVVGTAANGCTGTASTVVNVKRKPLINSFSPTSGPDLTLVTVSGDNMFSSSQVIVGGQSAIPSVTNNSSLFFNIPSSALSGNIIVVNSNGCSDTSAGIFTVVNDVVLQLRLYIEGYYDINSHQMSSPLFDSIQSDSVVVLLFDSADLNTPAFTVAGLFHLDGNGSFTFPSAVLNNSYYIVVKHRNTLEAWSKEPVLFTNNTSFEFSN